MKWIYAFAALGFNSLAYAAMVAFLYRQDKFADRHPRLYALAYFILWVLSLPGWFIFEAAQTAHRRRVFKVIDKEKCAVRAVANQNGIPSEWDRKLYGWEIERFVDDYDNFDLQGWKAHEYEKLGL